MVKPVTAALGSRSPNAIYGVWSLRHSCGALSAMMVKILYVNMPGAQSVKLQPG